MLTRARLLTVLLALAAVTAVAVGSSAHPDATRAAASARPSFVVIMTDDQTYQDMAAMPQTRHLIGDAGVTFTRSYVSYPLCCPSRATYLTGQYNHNNGVRSNSPPSGGFEALDGQHTLPVWMRAAGYDTSHIGKYLNGYGLRHAAVVPPGWRDWHGTIDKSTYQMWGYKLFEDGAAHTYGSFDFEDPALYQTDVLRDKALAFIDSHAADDVPYLLSLAFVAPHGEVSDPGSTTQPYVRPAPRHLGRFKGLRLPRSATGERDISDKPPYVKKLKLAGASTTARIRDDFRSRRESLLAVDEAVAAIVAGLERTGRLGSTYILFTSDNGFFQGEHRIVKGKYLAYDPSTHVPLLLRGPGIPAGAVSRELVVNADLAPTALDAAGATADLTLDGRSLLPFARDPNLRSDRPVLHEGLVDSDNDGDGARRTHTVGRYYAIRTDRFLYVQWRGGARELYDLERDPGELHSRHADRRYRHVRDVLSRELQRLHHCIGASCLAPVAPLRP
jgi:N-acetylglucosamine-6-sulfatase